MRRAAILGPLLLACSACNPAAGFQDAANAINPAEKSYLETPATQLTSGPYETIGVDVDLDTQVHLLARRRDQPNTMTLFGQDAHQGCQIAPNYLTWFVERPSAAPYRLLPYFETRSGQGVGRLRFTTLECELSDMTVEDAHDPYGVDVKDGFLVPVGQSSTAMTFVNPWAGTTRTLLEHYYGLVQAKKPLILWGDQQFVSYDDDLNELGRYGTNIIHAAVTSDGAIGIEEALTNADQTTTHKLERIVPPDDPSAPLIIEPMLDDACDMQGLDMYTSGWVLVRTPCSSPKVSAYYLGTAPITSPAMARLASFQTEVATWNARVITSQTDGKANDLTLFYLENVVQDPTSGQYVGTLYATRQADAMPVKIGDNASLSLVKRLPNVPTDSPWAGTAIVDAAAGVARWIQWSWDPSVAPQTLATNVYFDGSYSQVIANYDGTRGDSMAWSQTGAVVLQHGVPPTNTQETSSTYPYSAHLENYDGKNGDLLLVSGGATQSLGARVPINSYQFLDPLPMPGIAYVTNWDSPSGTGTLVAQNLKLGATTTIGSGVSAFTATGFPLPGILYAVPEGGAAGLWFAQAK